MSHFIKKCGYCNTVIAQCRCPSRTKELTYGDCGQCGGNAGVECTQEQFVKAVFEALYEQKAAKWPGRFTHKMKTDFIDLMDKKIKAKTEKGKHD
uniref:Uncharacterized protein n=1 Tax=uncultured marine virus TaxID=186617 RepID=A0A0F7L662_9VIRU|nr:hypothetical protein [uncultured marine virus]